MQTAAHNRFNRTWRAWFGASVSAGALCMFATAAHAQEAAGATPQPAAQQADTPASDLGTIVITASKRPENLQRAAIAVTALTSQALESRGIVDAGQLAGIAPGIQFQPSFVLLTYIRGIGNYSVQPATDQSIAYNVDGNYVSRPYGMPSILFDLNRIELVRGPQGTLQGRNAIAGSVNLVSNRPSKDFEARVAGSFGNYSAITTEGMINVPLGEVGAIRLSAASSDHDGYVKGGFLDGDTKGARARLLLTPAPRLEVLLTAEYTTRDEKGPGYSICPPGSPDAGCVGVKWRPWGGTPGQGTSEEQSVKEANYVKSRNYSYYGEINYDLGFGTLTWAPSYRNIYYRNHTSFSHYFGFAPAVHDALHQEEVRIASKASSPISWVAGLYWGRQKSREQNYFTSGVPPYITTNEPGFPELGHVFFKNDIDRYVYRSQAAFAQVLAPITDGLRIMLGGRYTEDKKTEQARDGLVYPGPVLVAVPTSAKQTLHKFTYKAGVEFDVTPTAMLYANYSTGFKSGGVNGVPNSDVLPRTFNPEEIKAMQGGIKSRWLDNKLQINAEAFHYDLKGYQTSALIFDPVTGVLFGGTVNSQKAEFYGAELESSLLVTRDDRFDVSLAYLHAEHKKFEIPQSGTNLSGKPVSNAPKFTLTGNYAHTFRFESGANLVAHVETRYESKQWVDYRLAPGTLQHSFWRHSADLTFNSADDRWSIGAFIRNITNDGALMHAIPGFLLGQYTVGLAYPPRTYGVRASAKF
ncbi:MAG: TonB-dependent receptor [Sphingomonadales bacterium]